MSSVGRLRRGDREGGERPFPPLAPSHAVGSPPSVRSSALPAGSTPHPSNGGKPTGVFLKRIPWALAPRRGLAQPGGERAQSCSPPVSCDSSGPARLFQRESPDLLGFRAGILGQSGSSSWVLLCGAEPEASAGSGHPKGLQPRASLQPSQPLRRLLPVSVQSAVRPGPTFHQHLDFLAAQLQFSFLFFFSLFSFLLLKAKNKNVLRPFFPPSFSLGTFVAQGFGAPVVLSPVGSDKCWFLHVTLRAQGIKSCGTLSPRPLAPGTQPFRVGPCFPLAAGGFGIF